MSAPAAGRDSTISLQLPEGWEEVPLDSSRVRAKLRAHFAALPPEHRTSAAVKRFEVVVSRMIDQVAAAGVVLAAVWSELVMDPQTEPADDHGLTLLLAAVTVATIDTGRLAGQVSPAVMRGALHARASDDDVRPLEDPSDVTLPLGHTIRQGFLRRMRTSDRSGPVPTVLVDRFAVALPTGGIAVADFQTPNLAVSDGFRELFLQMVQTLEVTQ